jgi:cytosine/adenosine deaminase-related metal-dependent hydrolase
MKKILIKDAFLIATMDDEKNKYENGYIIISGNKIESVGNKLPVGIKLEDYEIIDGKNCVVLPGFINTHHHLFQTLTRCLKKSQDKELFDWLTYLYDIWGKYLNPETVQYTTKLGCAELLLTGCTTCVDMFYAFPQNQPENLLDYEIESAKEVGIRFVACRGAMSCGSSQGGLPPDYLVQKEDKILKDYLRVIEKFHDEKEFSMTQIVLAPCSPFSVTEELLKETAKLAKEKNVLCHTHLAETKDEEKYCLENFCLRPLAYLENCGWLNDRSFFAHSIYLNDEEIKKLARSGAGVSHCPTSNLRLGSGIMRLKFMKDNGVNISLAVDGSASNDSSNMLSELRQCLLVHKYFSGPSSISAEDILWIATRGGAKVLHRDDIGIIAEGKAADIVMFRVDKLGYIGGLEDPLAALLYCGDSQMAETVIVNGKIVVKEGKLVTIDETKMFFEYMEKYRDITNYKR